MTTTFEIPTASLAAAVTHAPKADVRTYLVGVYVDTDKGRLVATDGHRMFVCACPAVLDPEQPAFTIPRALIATAVKAGKKAACITVTVIDPPAGGMPKTVTLTVNGASFGDSAVDGNYPQYERMIPSDLSGQPGWYNPAYLVDAHAALDTCYGRPSLARVYYNGADKACLVTSELVPALVVVMPIRVGDNPEVNPALDWFNKPGAV